MNRQKVHILLVEDDEDDVFLTRGYLAESNYYQFSVGWESSIEEAKEKILSNEFQVCLVDYRLGANTGIDLIHFVKDNSIRIPVIILTGQGDREVDLEAMRFGAADYLVKGEMNAQTLERSIRYALSRAEAIRELDAKEKRYRSLFERSIDPIFLADVEFRLVDVNAAMLSLFRYTREDMQQTGLGDIFLYTNVFDDFREAILKIGQVRDFEVALKGSGDHKMFCLINCVYISDPSSTGFYQGIIHDLTMRKKAERELLIAEKLSMTGKIARTIAHEVRNPLTNLNLALEQLKDEIGDNHKGSEIYTGIITRNANRIEQLISEMLNSSKPKELRIELTPVEEIIEETITLILDRINLNQMRLVRDIGQNLPRVLLDKEKMKIALLNILINAIEAMKPGEGVLQVRAERVMNQIIISVEDNGIGIPEEEIDKLFDPFYTGKQGGMGLGLTSTQSILNSHNAGIEVNSKVGEGTVFRILFNIID